MKPSAVREIVTMANERLEMIDEKLAALSSMRAELTSLVRALTGDSPALAQFPPVLQKNFKYRLTLYHCTGSRLALEGYWPHSGRAGSASMQNRKPRVDRPPSGGPSL